MKVSISIVALIFSMLFIPMESFSQKDRACAFAVKKCQKDAKKIRNMIWVSRTKQIPGTHDYRCNQILTKIEQKDIIIDKCGNYTLLKSMQRDLRSLRNKFKNWNKNKCSDGSLCKEIDDFYNTWIK